MTRVDNVKAFIKHMTAQIKVLGEYQIDTVLKSMAFVCGDLKVKEELEELYKGVQVYYLSSCEKDNILVMNKEEFERLKVVEFGGKKMIESGLILDTKVKYLRDIKPIEAIKKGDWTDLRAGEDIMLFKGQYAEIPLGVAIELPKGYEALMAARSSTFKKYGVIMVNSPAIMDESYCGDNDEWHFLAYATRNTVINKNERICQFRVIEHQPELRLRTVKTLGNADRGGIGSTGVI